MNEAAGVGEPFPRPAPRPLRSLDSLTVLKSAAAVVGFGAFSLAWRAAEQLIHGPLTEDGYYALTVARNIARGNGPTIDGEMLTNGFQPLFTFACALLYLPFDFDSVQPLRLVLGAQTLTNLATAWLVGLITRDAVTGGSEDERRFRQWFGTALYLSAVALFNEHHNGLETGLVLLLYAACWRFYQRRGIVTLRDCACFGGFLGLCVLARIDAVPFVCIWTVLAFTEAHAPFERARRAALVGGTALLLSSPWWLYNLTVFGHILPSSARAVQRVGADSERMWSMVDAVLRAVSPHLRGGPFDGWPGMTIVRIVLTLILGLAAVPLIRSWMSAAGQGSDDARRTWRFGLALAAHFVVLAVCYTVAVDSSWFYPRYMVGGALLSTVLLAAGLTSSGPLMRRLGVIGMLAATLLVLVRIGRLHDAETFAPTVELLQLGLVERHVPPDALVGAPGSGALGYFRDGVVNLDGKVNSAVLPFLEGRLDEYLEQVGIQYYVDEGFFTDRPETLGWRPVATATGRERFVLFARERTPR